MKNLYLAILAYIIVTLTAAPLLVYRVFATKSFSEFSDYMFSIAIGLDQLGGSLLYGKPDWTVSSYTHFLAINGSRGAYRFRSFIDFFFGENHCRDSYLREIALHREEIVTLSRRDGGIDV